MEIYKDMNKICTSIDQSQKLVDLGIAVDTADMWYHGHGSPWESEREYDSDACPFHSMRPNWDIPAWSLTALLKLTPYYILHSPSPLSEKYCCICVEYEIETYGDTQLDAVFEMIVWLKENNKL